MSKRKQIKYIHEGRYVAEVDVELHDSPDEWAPHLSLEDAYRLDDVRAALKRGDLEAAARHSRVFKMEPVAIAGQ